MTWKRHEEPLGVVLFRTVSIALVVGGVLAWRFHAIEGWPIASLLVLWFSLGGHWVELFFLDWMRPHLSEGRAVQMAARLAFWFVGGVGLGYGIALTMRLFAWTRTFRPPSWWAAGIAFVLVELTAHAALWLGRRPNFYNGEG